MIDLENGVKNEALATVRAFFYAKTAEAAQIGTKFVAL
jgi:hypothetical protein